MFNYRQLGEVEDDIFYFRDILESDIFYSNAMLSQPISDYEKERWSAEVSQFSGLLADIGIPNINYSQVFGGEEVLAAGFVSDNWPILAVLGVGLLVASRRGATQEEPHKRRKKRKLKRR